MTLTLASLTVVLALGARATPRDLGTSGLLDGSADEIVRQAFIPSADRVHGELRLVKRGDAWVMQTLIYSARLRRGVQRIEKKELYYWPPGSPGYDDSVRYLEDLETARARVLEEFAVSQQGRGDPRQKMLIELILAPRASGFAFYSVSLDESGERVAISAKTSIAVRSASRAYVERAMRIQAEEGFGAVPPELAPSGNGGGEGARP